MVNSVAPKAYQPPATNTKCVGSPANHQEAEQIINRLEGQITSDGFNRLSENNIPNDVDDEIDYSLGEVIPFVDLQTDHQNYNIETETFYNQNTGNYLVTWSHIPKNPSSNEGDYTFGAFMLDNSGNSPQRIDMLPGELGDSIVIIPGRRSGSCSLSESQMLSLIRSSNH